MTDAVGDAVAYARGIRRPNARLVVAVSLWAVLAAAVWWLVRGDPPPAGASLAPTAAAPPGATSVLFVGNSYTYVNDLPGTVARLAEGLGLRVAFESVAPGGWSLEQHERSKATQARIEAREWDFVVLQEQSERPAFDEGQVAREVFPAALALDARVHARAPHARTVFYETWARKDGDAPNCKAVPRVCTHDGMRARLADTYRALARKAGGVLAPVGTAWEQALVTHPEVNLYAADGSHPSPAGTYLAACVFVATLFGRSPVGAPPLTIPASDAAALQAIADRVAHHPDGAR
jgi:hypothetical protein